MPVTKLGSWRSRLPGKLGRPQANVKIITSHTSAKHPEDSQMYSAQGCHCGNPEQGADCDSNCKLLSRTDGPNVELQSSNHDSLYRLRGVVSSTWKYLKLSSCSSTGHFKIGQNSPMKCTSGFETLPYWAAQQIHGAWSLLTCAQLPALSRTRPNGRVIPVGHRNLHVRCSSGLQFLQTEELQLVGRLPPKLSKKTAQSGVS